VRTAEALQASGDTIS